MNWIRRLFRRETCGVRPPTDLPDIPGFMTTRYGLLTVNESRLTPATVQFEVLDNQKITALVLTHVRALEQTIHVTQQMVAAIQEHVCKEHRDEVLRDKVKCTLVVTATQELWVAGAYELRPDGGEYRGRFDSPKWVGPGDTMHCTLGEIGHAEYLALGDDLPPGLLAP